MHPASSHPVFGWPLHPRYPGCICSKDDRRMRLPCPQDQVVLQYSGARQRLTPFSEAWKSLIFNFPCYLLVVLYGMKGGLHMVLLCDSRWSSISKRNKCIDWTVHRDEEILVLSRAQMEWGGQPVTFILEDVSWVEILGGETHVSFSSLKDFFYIFFAPASWTHPHLDVADLHVLIIFLNCNSNDKKSNQIKNLHCDNGKKYPKGRVW